TLTATEVLNAKAYWTALWQAGGIEDQDRGAWRNLVAAHGSGRASWIVEQFKPIDLASKPSKPRPQDVILTIPLETPLAAGEVAPVLAFWRAVWLADGDGPKTTAPFTALAAAVGTTRAQEIGERLRPANFDTPLMSGATKASVNVTVTVVTFPTVETKQTAWSKAPHTRVLPDRFVLIAFEGSNASIVEVSNPLPSTLVVGPDPSAAKEDQIQHDDDGNLKVPDDLKWMTDFNRGVEVGMGFRIDLTELQARRGFDRVLVIGLRLNADETAAKLELETLLRHHAWSRTGLSVVPQGTPTNNTEATGSGHAPGDDS